MESIASMDETPINIDEAASILLKYMFSGVIGPGKGVMYSHIKTTETAFHFMASLEDFDEKEVPIDRYKVVIDRLTCQVQTPITLIALSNDELQHIIFSATGLSLKDSSRFKDGGSSVSYKASVETYDVEFVIQLRHHGDVSSMNAIMQMVSTTIDPLILPVPKVYPVSLEVQHQNEGMGVQVAEYIHGIMATSVYPTTSHEDKLVFLRKLALAFDALWQLPLSKRQIGELRGHKTLNEGIQLDVGPERHYSLGGPFTSVADYLRAAIKASLLSFQKQQGIDEYKARYLPPIKAFVETGMYNIPSIVEQIPIVPTHFDMGLHNIIVSESDHTNIKAIIDWEFCGALPYATVFYPIIESFFREDAVNGFGPEYPRGDELRECFWSSIPVWQKWNESEATVVFLEWFRFVRFMAAEYRPDDLDDLEKEAIWAENIRVVESFLKKYHS